MLAKVFDRLSRSFDDIPDNFNTRVLTLLDTCDGVVAPLESRNSQHLITFQLDAYDGCPSKLLQAIKISMKDAKGQIVARFIDNGQETHNDDNWGVGCSLTDAALSKKLALLGVYIFATHSIPSHLVN